MVAKNKDGTVSQNVRFTGSMTEKVNLQNGVTSPNDGQVFEVDSAKTLTLEITGSSTSRTILFEGSSVSGTYYPIQGVKLQDLSMASQTTGNNEIWQFDITGLETFRARISAVAGGSVTVKGKAVA